jgi:eukaryotic-like serine/threonine-protein kinase
VLYEMATGALPFRGESAGLVFDAILHRAPVAPVRLNPYLPVKLEDIIDKALEKNRNLRYQRAAEMRADLQRLKRDTETARISAASSGAVPTPQDSGHQIAVRQPVPASGSLSAAAHLPSSSAVRVPELPPLDYSKFWLKILVPVGVVVVAGLFVGGLYFHFRFRSTAKLTDKDTIVLADFTNSTGDSVFNDALKEALAIQLEQSPFLNVLSDQKVSTTLKLMNRPVDQPLTQEVTREICLRTESKGLLIGSIANIGTHYLLGLKAMNCQTGDTLGSAEAEVEGREKVLKALERVGNQLRGKLGESLASVEKFNRPLEQATTSSLEALQSYTQGVRAWEKGGDAESLPFLKHALELDPNFARAYVQLGGVYQNINQASRGVENFRKAYQLRDRASERERFFIEATYYAFATGELEKADQSYTLALRTYPRDDLLHTAAGINFGILGQYERALAEGQESLRLVATGYAYSNLMNYCIALNRLDEAKGAFEQALAHKLDSAFARLARYELAFLQGDNPAMQEQVAWAIGKPGAEDMLLSAQSDTEAYYGRLAKAHDFSQRAMESAKRAEAKEAAALWQMSEAVRIAEFGNPAQVRHLTPERVVFAPPPLE